MRAHKLALCLATAAILAACASHSTSEAPPGPIVVATPSATPVNPAADSQENSQDNSQPPPHDYLTPAPSVQPWPLAECNWAWTVLAYDESLDRTSAASYAVSGDRYVGDPTLAAYYTAAADHWKLDRALAWVVCRQPTDPGDVPPTWAVTASPAEQWTERPLTDRGCQAAITNLEAGRSTHLPPAASTPWNHSWAETYTHLIELFQRVCS